MHSIFYPLLLILGTAIVVHALGIVVPASITARTTLVVVHRNVVVCQQHSATDDINAHHVDATDAVAVGSNNNDDPSIECFVIHENTPEENEKVIICTSEPDEYAWFNGIDRDAMKPATDRDYNASLSECVEGASPRGIPEWECK